MPSASSWSLSWSCASVGRYVPTLAAMRLACVIPGRLVGAVLRSPLARLACVIPGRGVVGDVLPGPAPLHAVRVQQGDAPSLRSVTLPAWPLPAFRSAAWSVVPPLRAEDGPSLRCSRVQASSPLATGLLMPRACPRRLGRHAACQALRSPRQSQAPPLCRCREVGVREGRRVSTGNGRRRRTAPSSAPS